MDITHILNAANNSPTISHEETIELARKVQKMLCLIEFVVDKSVKGFATKFNLAFQIYEAAENHTILNQGKRAREKLILANQRLVINVAKRYKGLSLGDRIQHGMIGLAVAVEKFDPERGYRFSTYAVWRIKQSIMHGIQTEGRTMRIPGYVGNKLYKIERAIAKMEETGDAVTYPNLAERTALTEKEVEFLMPIRKQTTALHPQQDKALEASDDGIPANVWTALGSLEKTALEAVALRFGLADGNCWDFEDIAAALNITDFEVRTAIKQALEALKSSCA